MPETFGARLRQQRERQQIALITIAEQTKIKPSLLEGLERDDVSHWPGGIFRRAFIRSYADAIGLEADVVVREFLTLHPDPIEVVATSPAIAADEEGARTSAGPPTRLRYLVSSAIGSLVRLRAAGVQRAASAVEDVAPAGAAMRTPAPPEPDLQAQPVPGLLPPPDAGLPPLDPSLLPPPEPDLLAAAQLCTELARVGHTTAVVPLLKDAATILDAVGLIVWVWDPHAAELRPVLAHGYSDQVLAQLPTIRRETDNATAAAFRSARICAVESTGRASGALVVPLMTPVGCVGVLAIELLHGSERTGSVRALVTIFAAQLARLIGASRPAEASDRKLA